MEVSLKIVMAMALSLGGESPPEPQRATQTTQCGRKACDCGCESGEPCRCASVDLARKACPCSAQCECGCNEGVPCICVAARGASVLQGGATAVRERAATQWRAPATYGGVRTLRLAPRVYPAPAPAPAPRYYYQAPQPRFYSAPARRGRPSGC